MIWLAVVVFILRAACASGSDSDADSIDELMSDAESGDEPLSLLRRFRHSLPVALSPLPLSPFPRKSARQTRGNEDSSVSRVFVIRSRM